MRIAASAWPTGSLIVGALALGALAVPRGHRVYTATASVTIEPTIEPKVEPAPEPTTTVDVPGNARYFSVDMDGDGVPELAAETADFSQVVIVKAYGHAPIATIPLIVNDCMSELAIEDGVLVAHDYAGPTCAEARTRKFRIHDGQLATVTVWPTQLTIVDN